MGEGALRLEPEWMIGMKIFVLGQYSKSQKKTRDCFVQTFHSFIWFKPWPADWSRSFLVSVMKNFPKNGILISEKRS